MTGSLGSGAAVQFTNNDFSVGSNNALLDTVNNTWVIDGTSWDSWEYDNAGEINSDRAFLPGKTIALADYGTPYNGIDDANSGDANQYNRTLISNQGTELADGRTPGSRAYDGVRFDNNKLTYYMNADGFLVARYFEDFTYNSGATGNTRNYTT